MPGAAKPFFTCKVPLTSTTQHTTDSGLPITPGMQTKVMIENKLAIVVGDLCSCPVLGNKVVQGSQKVFFQNQAAARDGDLNAHPGSKISQGSSKVIIG